MNTITIAEIQRGDTHAMDATVCLQTVEAQPAVSDLDYFLAIPVPQGDGLSVKAMGDRIQGLRDDRGDH